MTAHRSSPSRRLARTACLLGALAMLGTFASNGCAFDAARRPVPTYLCGSNPCVGGMCIEGVCAAETVSSPYELVLRTIVPSTWTHADVRTNTITVPQFAASGTRDLPLPTPHGVYGRVRFESGDTVIPSQVTLTRTLAVGARFIDEVRTVAPGPAVSDDAAPADYRVDVASTTPSIAVVQPSPTSTVLLPGMPAHLVGMPLDQILPPMVGAFDPTASADSSSRLDFIYPASVFTSCVGTSATSCTAVGRLVSVDGTGTNVPEPDLRVVLESVETGQAISTVTTSDANGLFEIRISRGSGPVRLRVSSSDARPAYPSVSLVETAFDPFLGGDVVVPAVSVVHYVGRVEQAGNPVSYAIVRAIGRALDTSSGQNILGAQFEATVRTTTTAETDGAGFFALDLVPGTYDFVVSDPATATSVVQASALVAKPPGGGPQQGQTFQLAALIAVGGNVTGPDDQHLPYTAVQAIPYIPWGSAIAVEAWARPSLATTDDLGFYDLLADAGRYDLVASNSLAYGLPVAVIPSVTIRRATNNEGPAIRIPRAAVLSGNVTSSMGLPIPDARVEAYLLLPSDNVNSDDRTIPLGQVVADYAGRYMLLLPSKIGL